MSLTSLPLLTMGVAALLASAYARQSRWRLRTIGALLILLGVVLLGLYVAFYGLNIPLATRATPPEMKVGIWKSMAKTTMLGILFPLAYLIAGWAALRNYSLEGESREV